MLIEQFNLQGNIFCPIKEMNIKTCSNERYMTYIYYIKQPLEMVEINVNMLIAKIPNLTKALERKKFSV